MLDLDEIKRRVDLRAFVAGLLPRGQHSASYDQYSCPFHSNRNRTPSMTVWIDHWYCFGCEQGGSVLDFIMQYESCTLLEAARKLEGKQEFQHKNPPQSKEPEKKPPIPMELVHEHFKNIEKGLPYFEQRCITDPTAHREKLGVNTNFRSIYEMEDGEKIAIYAERYAVPNIFDGRVRAINYRRNDDAFMASFERSSDHDRILFDVERQLGGVPLREDILDIVAGPKYKQDWRSTWKPFNVGLLKRREGKEMVNIPQNYILIHAETKEFDTLALTDFGFPTVGVRLNTDIFEVLPSLFSHVPLLYIVKDNDDAGMKKAIALQQCLGRGRIIAPPKDYKDSGEVAMDGQVYKWMNDYGLEPVR